MIDIQRSGGAVQDAAPPSDATRQDPTDRAPELPPAQVADLESAIADLRAGSQRWAGMPLAERAALLREVVTTTTDHAQRWTSTGAGIKGLHPDSPLVGEEWDSGPYVVLASLDALAHSIEELAAGRSPLDGARFGTAPGGRTTVQVLPTSALEGVLLNGFSAQVWLPPGVDAATARERAGLGQLTPTRSGGVGLVLGAGNITSIAPLDVLHELVANNRTTLLKLNPVMEAMLAVYLGALRPLVDAGLLRLVQGGADVGAFLAHHPGIDHVHVTGSATTHDAVVFGPGDEGRARRAAGTPLLAKPITSELGGVSPVIVVPGAWTHADLRFQAEHVATQRLHNGGYNCIAAQVVLISADWPQKGEFLDQLRSALGRAPGRRAWYPGSDERVAGAGAAYPAATRLGPDGGRLLVEVGAGDAAPVQSTEYFSPVLGVRELPGTGAEFLDAAVTVADEELAGTLGANVIVDPRTLAQLGGAFDEALQRLRYGMIAVNAWTGLGFLTATAPWGAFGGATPADVGNDIGSGVGTVHNALLIDAPERTVLRGPFRPFPRSVLHGEAALFPKPPWFVTARSAAATGKALTALAASPGWARLPKVLLAAFRA